MELDSSFPLVRLLVFPDAVGRYAEGANVLAVRGRSRFRITSDVSDNHGSIEVHSRRWLHSKALLPWLRILLDDIFD
jgi:hypothetical protein